MIVFISVLLAAFRSSNRKWPQDKVSTFVSEVEACVPWRFLEWRGLWLVGGKKKLFYMRHFVCYSKYDSSKTHGFCCCSEKIPKQRAEPLIVGITAYFNGQQQAPLFFPWLLKLKLIFAGCSLRGLWLRRLSSPLEVKPSIPETSGGSGSKSAEHGRHLKLRSLVAV